MSSQYLSIADAAAAKHKLTRELAVHLDTSKREESRIRFELSLAEQAIQVASQGIDLQLISVAESVIYVGGSYTNAGEDKRSVLDDAIAQIATGEKQSRSNLWSEYFGTKDYAHWHGQRSDHGYGYGPRHGSVIFSIGFKLPVRDRCPQELTEEERQACVYYLTNLERIQSERAKATGAKP